MRASPEGFILVLTTLGSTEAARTLVRDLLDAKLVACGTIVPGTVSLYRWQGDVTEADEALVLLKTRRECWDRLAERVRSIHPYEVPELIAVPVTAGLEGYLRWVQGETTAEEHG